MRAYACDYLSFISSLSPISAAFSILFIVFIIRGGVGTAREYFLHSRIIIRLKSITSKCTESLLISYYGKWWVKDFCKYLHHTCQLFCHGGTKNRMTASTSVLRGLFALEESPKKNGQFSCQNIHYEQLLKNVNGPNYYCMEGGSYPFILDSLCQPGLRKRELTFLLTAAASACRNSLVFSASIPATILEGFVLRLLPFTNTATGAIMTAQWENECILPPVPSMASVQFPGCSHALPCTHVCEDQRLRPQLTQWFRVEWRPLRKTPFSLNQQKCPEIKPDPRRVRKQVFLVSLGICRRQFAITTSIAMR